MDEPRRERRARRRWEKEMLRRLEELDELDELDRRYGLGASSHSGPVDRPRHRGMPRVERRRRGAGPVLPGMLVVFCLLLFVFFKSPGTTGDRLRQFVDGMHGGDDEAYAFVSEGPNGLPVGWNACEPIHYVVNAAGAPDDWQDIIDAAVSEVEDASGFTLASDGLSDDRTADRRSRSSGALPVLIDWATPEEVPDLQGDTVGIGGSSAFTSHGESRFVTGVVVLDEQEYDRMSRAGQDRAAVLILAHELGHVLGLDHVEDTNQLMNPTYVGQSGFGDGDVAGFKVLHDLPCG